MPNDGGRIGNSGSDGSAISRSIANAGSGGIDGIPNEGGRIGNNGSDGNAMSKSTEKIGSCGIEGVPNDGGRIGRNGSAKLQLMILEAQLKHLGQRR